MNLQVARHCACHGLALNVTMDLEPFSRINPCGHAGLPTVDLRTLGVAVPRDEAAAQLSQQPLQLLAPV